MGKLKSMNVRLLVIGFLAFMTILLPDPILAFRQPNADRAPVPDFDIRGYRENALPQDRPPKPLSQGQEKALSALKGKAKGLMYRWSALTNAPSRLYSLTEPLTKPRKGQAKEIALTFLMDHLELFNLSPQDVEDLKFTRDFITKHNGVTHLTIQQRVDGIDVFEGTMDINIGREGQVISVSGELIPKIRGSINASRPLISAEEAMAKAVESAGILVLREGKANGVVYFPMTHGQLRLAWDVTIQDSQTPNAYRVLVDAVKGNILWRKCLVAYLDPPPARGLVFTRESPVPNTPIGASTGEVAREEVPFHGAAIFGLGDPHMDWWNGSGESNRNRTISNNARVMDDRDKDNDDNEGIVETLNEDFSFALDYPINLTAHPDTYTSASVVNLFYWLNRLHNIFYQYGFDEAAGNYQNDNFGLGGVAGDPLRGHAQDAAEGCNAHSFSSSDGGTGKIQTGMCGPCDGVGECRDIAFEGQIIAHEFGHSIHFRLRSFSGVQRMTEGIADFTALAALAEPGDDLRGSYPIAQWALNNINGIRRKPYSTDQTVFPYTYGTIANNPGLYEVGEVWCNTLWMARANLVWKYGFAAGHPTMMSLFIDGMKLAPNNPDFLDMRDAILLSDQMNHGGMNQCLLWDAFAKMGLGFSAKSTGPHDQYPLEAFDLPPACTPNIQINASLEFGKVCPGNSKTASIEIFNTAFGELIVDRVYRKDGSMDITVEPNPTLPLFIGGGSHVNFSVTCAPSSTGMKTATIRIESNDPDQPAIELTATCNAEPQKIATVIPNNGNFGDVCFGTFKDLDLTISNSGGCPLRVIGITSSAVDFKTASIISYPLVIGGGSSIQVPVRFKPTTVGAKAATLNVASDDPLTPNLYVPVSGNAPTGDIRVTGSADFGDVCAETMAEKTVSICNVGKCNLSVTSASVNCADFSLPNNPFPAPISPDSCVGLAIRFTPTSAGPKSCQLTIVSDDPDSSSVSLPLTANIPLASIDVPPDQTFLPAVVLGLGSCFSMKPFPISNTGKCNLTITEISIFTNPDEFVLAGLPSFPIILKPGDVVGQGALKNVFAPDFLGRNRSGQIRVTYIPDPITGVPTSVTRNLCGEGVYTGARILVTSGGVPIPMVEQIKIQRLGGNRNKKIVDTVDIAKDLPLRSVNQCTSFSYHREYGTVENPIQLLPGSYEVTVTAMINGKRKSKTVGFDLSTCTFHPSIIIDF